MSLTLLKATLKKNWTLLIIFSGVLSMYMTIIISMYNPDDMEALTAMLSMFPEDMMKAMGFASATTDLAGFLASFMYGMLMLGFPMVYSIILGNRLVAKMVDNSSFACLLSTPNSRVKIILTQGVYAVLSIIVLFACLFGIGVLTCEALFPGALDVGAFLKLNITTMLVNLVVMMICFFFSCLFNESKLSLGFGAGIPIMFLLMNMLGGVSADAEALKRLSIYGLYNPVELVHGAEILGTNVVYIGIVIVLFVSSILVFNKKRLPL